MRLTMRTDLAIRALMFCAANPETTVRKSDIARACNASPNHLGHVINLLGQSGHLTTTRGRQGGLRLARAPKDIQIGSVCRELEADLPFAECFSAHDNTCPLTASCRMQGVLKQALNAFYDCLDQVSLADLTDDNDLLCGQLAISGARGTATEGTAQFLPDAATPCQIR